MAGLRPVEEQGEEPGRVGVVTGWDKVGEGTAAETWLRLNFCSRDDSSVLIPVSPLAVKNVVETNYAQLCEGRACMCFILRPSQPGFHMGTQWLGISCR